MVLVSALIPSIPPAKTSLSVPNMNPVSKAVYFSSLKAKKIATMRKVSSFPINKNARKSDAVL